MASPRFSLAPPPPFPRFYARPPVIRRAREKESTKGRQLPLAHVLSQLPRLHSYLTYERKRRRELVYYLSDPDTFLPAGRKKVFGAARVARQSEVCSHIAYVLIQTFVASSRDAHRRETGQPAAAADIAIRRNCFRNPPSSPAACRTASVYEIVRC